MYTQITTAQQRGGQRWGYDNMQEKWEVHNRKLPSAEAVYDNKMHQEVVTQTWQHEAIRRETIGHVNQGMAG